jgi:hypothetical protein
VQGSSGQHGFDGAPEIHTYPSWLVGLLRVHAATIINSFETLEKPAKIYPDPRLRLERMADPLQLGFSDYEQIYTKKRTRRQRFLDEMEAKVP